MNPAPEFGAVAQLGERCNRTAEVRGSNPLSSTIILSQAVEDAREFKTGNLLP